MASVRTRIFATLGAASVLGVALNTQAQVHDYFRAVRDEDGVNTLLKYGSKLHAWFVSLDGDKAMNTVRSNGQLGRDPMFEYARYAFALYGYYSVDDASQSEKVWANIVEDVFDAFRADKKLNNTVINSGPLQWARGGGGEGCVMFPAGKGGVLCHFAKLTLDVFEELGP